MYFFSKITLIALLISANTFAEEISVHGQIKCEDDTEGLLHLQAVLYTIKSIDLPLHKFSKNLYYANYYNFSLTGSIDGIGDLHPILRIVCICSKGAFSIKKLDLKSQYDENKNVTLSQEIFCT
uniref:Transthyretin-like family-containing protein n=1 Tax=Rhabditophanes sp. KR3021 TaxID=114890 RepID=A0AC35TNI8_9BILA